jgi:AraC family transcriptional regulator
MLYGTRDGQGRQSAAFRTEFPPQFEQLIRSLATIPASGSAITQLYVEGVSMAVAAQLVVSHGHMATGAAKPKIPPLPKWRLKRVIDFIEVNIAEPITLPALAQSAGLTRMYFAAQFREATGLRPHDYVLRRRIERAQDMLLDSDITLMETAFSTGFQTQAHFTTVFKKMVGQPPHQWRERYGHRLQLKMRSTLTDRKLSVRA